MADTFEATRLEEAVPTTLRVFGGGEHDAYRLVELQRRDGRYGAIRWSVNMRGRCLSKKTLDWEWEPLPSSRTDEFLSECRFDSAEEAFSAWRSARERGIEV